MLCPGQYNESAPMHNLRPATPITPPVGQVQANIVSMQLNDEAFSQPCVDVFVFKTHLATEDGSFAPYLIVQPSEGTPGQDLVFDFCVFGCPCELQ